ncbi:MAG: TlpA family protein disulfide reductase [Myxococcales bacterium]|nr:TlpA family protein disulfide reductase [Myxococcales bacterium]MCB9643227.1 TlpA family protein disulfide reductase [Myxococcales bacterium]
MKQTSTSIFQVAFAMGLFLSLCSFSAYAGPPHPYLSRFPKAEKELEKLLQQAQIQALEPQPADLSIKLLDARESRLYNLARHRGKVIVLSRWATWCSACKGELPSKLAMVKQLQDPRLVLLGVSEEEREVVRGYEKDSPNKYPISLIDTAGILQKFFPSSGLPTTVLIDAWGWVIGMKVGGIQWDSPASIALMRYMLSMRPAKPLREQAPAPKATFSRRIRVRVNQTFRIPITLRWNGETDKYERLIFRLPKDATFAHEGIETSGTTSDEKGNQRTYILKLKLMRPGRFELKPILLNYWLKDYDQHFQTSLGSIAIQASALAPLSTIPPWALWTSIGAMLVFLAFLGLALQRSSQQEEA